MANVVVKIVQGKAQLQWRAERGISSDCWVGICDPMGLTIEANSLDELYGLIDETMQLVLTDILRDNELDQFLLERGWRVQNMPTVTRPEDVRFNVPWELIAESARDSERRPD
ncbi:MAG: hypothetical protein V1796_00260 [Pseudomonadota bacterium]